MSITIEAVRNNNDFRPAQNLPYLLSCIGEKVTIEVDFIYEDITYASTLVGFENFIELAPPNAQVGLADTTNIIQSEDGAAFKNAEVGDTWTVRDVGAATFTDYTIIEKIDEGIIRVGTTLVNTILNNDSYIYNKTPFEGVRYAYNLVPSGSSFNSLIDGEYQQGEIETADATVLTNQDMLFTGLKSYQIGSLKIKGRGTAGIDGATGGGDDNVQQLFTITHETVITPLFLADQYNNLLLGKKPPYYEANNTLNYIAKISLGRDLTNPNRVQELIIPTSKSNNGWYNERFNGGVNNYAISSLVLTDVAAATTVSQLEYDKEIKIDIIIDNTVDSPFSDTNTQFIFGFNYLPEDKGLYQGNGFDQKRNFALDYKINTIGVGTANGDNIGNSLQIIKTVEGTYISDTQMKVTAIIETASGSDAILQQGDFSRYNFWVITENHALDPEKSDKVPLLASTNDFFVQQVAIDPVISSAGAEFITHPYTADADSIPGANLNLCPVDDLVAKMKFSLDFTPTAGVDGETATTTLLYANADPLEDMLLLDITNNKTIAVASVQGTRKLTLERLRDSLNDNVAYGTVFGGNPAYVDNGGYKNATTSSTGFDDFLYFDAPSTGTLYNGISLGLSTVSSALFDTNVMAGGVDAIPASVSSQGVIIKNIQSKILLRDGDGQEADILLEDFSFSTEAAPLIGLVQDINFSQDRVFKIPNGIRKTITCLRDYASDTAFEKFFNYKYPFMHRWEYWTALLNALTVPAELFDNTQPNNGINHFWHRYTTIAFWHIAYDVVFTLEQNGVEFTQTFKTELADSTDFDGNPDWTSNSIKSFDLNTATELTSLGIQYLYGFENVEIQAKFNKTTGTVPSLVNVGIVMWIEPFEKGGIPDVRRFSSFYIKGDETWFESSDSSDKVVVSKLGSEYTGTLEVDYTKLPADNKFTLYARMYELYPSNSKQFMGGDVFQFMNGDIYQFMGSGSHPLVFGTAIKQDFEVIRKSPLKSLTEPPIAQDDPVGCCFGMPALAETAFTSETKNDVHSPYFVWNNAFTSAEMTLQRFDGGIWVTVATLNDNTYGKFNAFAFFITMFQESAIAYELEWSKVLTINGSGRYRVRCQATPFTSATPVDQFSLEFCLFEYQDNLADKTTRWTWFLNGTIGDENDDEHKIDYGILDWRNQIRLPNSLFGNDKSAEHEKEFVKYQNGKQTWIKDSQVESYTLMTGSYPSEIHRFIKINILMADDIFVTDYNKLNPNKHVDTNVTWIGTYEPKYTKGVLKSPVETEFNQSTQNLNHKRC